MKNQKNTIFRFPTILLITSSILLSICLSSACTNKTIVEDIDILVIHSFKKDLISYPDMNQMIVERMKTKGYNATLHICYLNCDALGEKEEIYALKQFLDSTRIKPHIILTTDDPATYSLLASEHDIVKKTPIVFTGVNFPNWALLNKYQNVTGIWDKLNYLATVEMIETLMGHQRIRFYYDRTYIGRKTLEILGEQLCDRDRELSTMIAEFLKNPNLPRLDRIECSKFFSQGEKLTSKLQNTQFYFQNLRDEVGGIILWYINGNFEQSVSLLTRYDYTISRIGNMSTIPTFSAVSKEFGYGQGILGGHFMSLEDQVNEACDYMAQILNGTDISSLPIKEGRKKSMLDWEEMKRWGIKKSDVEKTFYIVNMPYIEKHKIELIIAGSILGVLIIFIISYLSFLFVRESKRKRMAQQSLQEEKDFLSLVLEGGNIFAWSYQHEGEYFIFDKEFTLCVGLNSEIVTLDKFIQFLHPNDVDITIDQFINVINNKKDKGTVSARIKFSGDKFEWYEFRMLGLPQRGNNKKEVIGAILSVQDFKENEEKLIAARDLAAKTELKQSFLANMSHEIRTPLNAIVGFSNILVADESLLEEEKREFISTINTNCELLLKLINDILEISRIESGNTSFQFKDYSVNRLIEEIYQMNYLTTPTSISFIHTTLTDDIIINTDIVRLKQVLVNFVSNAFKFTHSGHVKIGVEYNNSKKEIWFYVEDTGIGIPEEEQKMIFDRFYKYDQFTQGTGLGLSISNVITEKLQGKITLESKINEGSRFGVILPCSIEKEDSNTIDNMLITKKNDIATTDTEKPTILIAEDSASNYMILSQILKKHYSIVWALNGQDAVDIISNQPIDLVLMDIKMPKMDGITALKKIKKLNKNIPIIIQSAYAYNENREQASKAGCSDFIEKPIQVDLLMQAIKKHLPST